MVLRNVKGLSTKTRLDNWAILVNTVRCITLNNKWQIRLLWSDDAVGYQLLDLVNRVCCDAGIYRWRSAEDREVGIIENVLRFRQRPCK